MEPKRIVAEGNSGGSRLAAGRSIRTNMKPESTDDPLREAHRRRCEGKAAFPRASLADRAAMRISARLGELIISYQCCDCGRWHVGHADSGQKQIRMRSITPRCVICGAPIPQRRLVQARRSGTLIHTFSKQCRFRYKLQRRDERDAGPDRGLTDEMAFEFAARYLPWLPPAEAFRHRDVITRAVMRQGSQADIERVVRVALRAKRPE